MKIVNCTPHPITVKLENGSNVTFEPSGIVPRVSTTEVTVGKIAGIPCVKQETGKVIGLPQPKQNTLFVVSRMVFEASDRTDLIVPDTGKGAIRDEKGRIIAVTRFIVKK